MTWTIPLRITLEPGSELSFTVSGAVATHALSDPPQSTIMHGVSAAPSPAVEVDPAAAVKRVRKLIGQYPDVLEVREGFLWRDGLMTERRAVVVVLDPCVPSVPCDPYERLRIPREVEGLPVDITLGGPATLWRVAGHRGPLMGEALPVAELLQERVPQIGYVKPEGLSLDEVREPMEVVCHVSPDDGWSVLRDFLSRVEKKLTIGILNLSAPHVVGKLMELAREKPAFHLNLILQRGGASNPDGAKECDLDEEEVVKSLRAVMGSRFRQAYASVSGDTRTFASSYQLKVAVRDGEELWLSSGNMQGSNQPPPEVSPAVTREQSFGPLKRYNREWHVVVKNERLAQTFESYLLYDLETAEANPAPPLSPVHELFVHAERFAPDTHLSGESTPACYFAHKVIRREEHAPVIVRPLLTPDDYLAHIIRLVRSAQHTLFIQNQSLSLLDPLENNEAAFVELWEAIRSRQDADVDVRMIFRVHLDEDRARAVKDRLVKFGFKPGCIRAQQGCHTKGLIVDSEAVLVGSHNWTNQGVTANRDASLIFHHPEIARYYERIFLFDWERLAREPRPAGPDSIGRGDSRGSVSFAWPGFPQLAGAARLGIRDLLDD